MNPLNLGGVLMGATFMVSGIFFIQTAEMLSLKLLSYCLVGLGGYIIWLHVIQENYMVNV